MTIADLRVVISAHLFLCVFAACDMLVPISDPCYTPRVGSSRELARRQDKVSWLVIDDHHVYWLNDGTERSTGALMRVAKTGGEPQVLAANQAGLRRIAMDDDAIYWISWDREATSSQLLRLAKTGGDATLLAVALDTDDTMAIDDQYVYLTADDFLVRVPKLGGPMQVLAPLTGDHLQGIAVDDHQVYFTEWRRHLVSSVAKIDGETAAFAQTCLPGRLTAADGYVYWWSSCPDVALFRASSPNEPAVPLVPGEHSVLDVAVASDRVYFTEYGEYGAPGGIYEVDVNGGDLEMLVGGGCGYTGIAVDATTIYYTNYVKGTVNAVAR
jgi:hypothetical protein